MKPSLIALLTFITFSTSVGQTEIKDVPEGTKKIVVVNNLSALENYNLVLNVLTDNDFEIEKKDKELLVIKSGSKSLPEKGSYHLNFECKDNSIEIKGKLSAVITFSSGNGVSVEEITEDITNKGLNGSIYKTAFIEMHKTASLIGTNYKYY